MHIVWISTKITVSELKQPWSVCLQSMNSAIFWAETIIIRTENLWSLLKITKRRLTLMKISEYYWKCQRTVEFLWKSLVISENAWTSMKTYETLLTLLKVSESCSEHLLKSLVISENVWILRKTFENYCFNSETVWKLLMALFIVNWSSTYVLSTLYELHSKNPKRNRKYFNYRDKTNTHQAKN